MIARTSTTSFTKQMNNIVNYSLGFLEGVDRGKKIFFDRLGKGAIQALAQYIDVQARANPKALHHVYEWNQVSSPNARLFNLGYTVSNLGLSVNSTFKQSRTVKEIYCWLSCLYAICIFFLNLPTASNNSSIGDTLIVYAF